MTAHDSNGKDRDAQQGEDTPEDQTPGFDTRAVHTGMRVPEDGTRGTNVPIYATTTFLSEDADALDGVLGGTRPGYVYGRYGNPTITALEKTIAALEGATAAVAFSSGMAALHAALLLCELEPGSTVLASNDLYGASHTLLGSLFGGFDVRARFVDTTGTGAVEKALSDGPAPRVLLFETVSNPLIKVADAEALCRLGHAAGATVIVDSTFTPPPLVQALAHGADIVVHSATKYLGGHGDVVGGMVAISDPDLEAPLRQVSKLTGSVLGPFEAFLINRGIKTLGLRLRQQCENAAALADWLASHPAVARVHYPGLTSHAQHELANRLIRRPYYGAMLAFEIEGAGRTEIHRLFDAFRMVVPATTLGDVYTEVSYPLMSSHREWSPAQLKRSGITPGLVRVSAGIENIGDIIADFAQALDRATGGTRPVGTGTQPVVETR